MPLFSPDFVSIDGHPEIEPSLKLDFANARALDPRVTFARASTATYVDSNGLVKIAGEDEARFDHDPTTGESLGLLIEEQRTNLIARSYGIGSGWGNNGTSTSTDFTAYSPYGVAVSTKITEQNTNNYHATYYQSVSVDGSSQYTLSAWLKKATTYNTSANGTGNFQLYCSRGTGGVASITIAPTFTSYSFNNADNASLTQYPNGWIRVSLTFTSNAAATVDPHFLFGGGGFYQGDGTNAVYIWGVQFEQGSFVTSFIPTDGATVTRTVDTAQIDRIQFHNPSEFVLYAAGRSNTGASITSGSTTGCLVSLGDTTNDYRFMLRKYRYNSGSGINTGFTFRYRNANDGINMDMFPNYYDGLADGYDTTTIAPIWDDFNTHRSALAFEAGVSTDNIRGCADGTLVVPEVTTPGSYSTVSNPTEYTQATTLQIGDGSSSGPFNGTISEVRYYPKRLPNAQLQTLTQ